MIIVNADDFGRSVPETNVVIECYRAGRLSSATAMVFMQDARRAAGVVGDTGIEVGLHLNLSQPFDAAGVPAAVKRSHDRVVRFLTMSRFAVLVYNPLLRRDFRDVVEAQMEEFRRLYGKDPSHIDGHQHQHLCANVLLDDLLPQGYAVRRSFSFFRGEKSAANRQYRAAVDRRLSRHHKSTDYFFSLESCLATGRMGHVFELSRSATVELMTHPVKAVERTYLMGADFGASLTRIGRGSWGLVHA